MRFLTSLAYVVLSLFVGLILINLSFDLIPLTDFTMVLNYYILLNPWYNLAIGLLGILLILLVIRHLHVLLANSYQAKSISLESAQGKVSITIAAIEDMLKKMLEAEEKISHVRPKITTKKNEVTVNLRAYLTSSSNLIESTQGIQDKIKTKLEMLLGEKKNIIVKVDISKVLSKHLPLNEEGEPEIPFRNY